MSVVDTVLQKLLALPQEKQIEVLEFVERVERKPAPTVRRKSPRGAAAHVRFHISLDEFKQLRREMWGTSTDRELDRRPQ
jgi:hypothetical protein